MTPLTFVLLSGALSFGLPLAFAVRELLMLWAPPGGGDGEPRPEPRSPPAPRPLPACLLPAPARAPLPVRVLEDA
jgi:hypothetical protein